MAKCRETDYYSAIQNPIPSRRILFCSTESLYAVQNLIAGPPTSIWPHIVAYLGPQQAYGHIWLLIRAPNKRMATYCCLFLPATSIWPHMVAYLGPQQAYGHILLFIFARNKHMATYCCLFGPPTSIWPHIVAKNQI